MPAQRLKCAPPTLEHGRPKIPPTTSVFRSSPDRAVIKLPSGRQIVAKQSIIHPGILNNIFVVYERRGASKGLSFYARKTQ